jgi:hypothetical protein
MLGAVYPRWFAIDSEVEAFDKAFGGSLRLSKGVP